MAETRDVIVRGSTGDTKSYIRIGDQTPLTPSETGSTLEFLQNLSSSLCTFDNAGTTSAFRIRHDTVNGALIFQGRTGSSGVIHSLLQFQDEGTVKFTAPVTFESIGFEDILAGQITSSYLHIYSQSQLEGTTSVQLLSLTSSLGTASIWYDGTQMHIDGFTSGGNSWKTQYKITDSYYSNSYYNVYTSSADQLIQDYNYLSVFLNGSLLYASGSIADWDYQTGSSLVTPSIKFRYNLPYTQQDEWWLGYIYSGGES